MAFLEVSDIKNRHIKSFPTAELQGYVDDANKMLIDYSESIGVPEADIVQPLRPIVRSFALSMMYMDFARDKTGATGYQTAGDGGVYETIYAMAKQNYTSLKPQMVKSVLTQTASSREDSAVSFGTLVRS